MDGPQYPPVATKEDDFAGYTPIDEGESFALLQAEAWGRSLGRRVIVVANDNQPVGYAHTNGYSKNDVIDGHIAAATICGKSDLTVIIGDVPGLQNLADKGTRPMEVYLDADLRLRGEATWRCLNDAYEHYVHTGGQYLLRRRTDPGVDVEPPVVPTAPDDDPADEEF